MNKATFSLNYRKPKSQYKDDEELIVCIRYYYKLEKCKTIAKNYKNLASDAIKNSNAKPPSKYKRGMIVRLTQKRVNEIKKACNNKWTGEMPFHNLIVYCDPHWNGNNWVETSDLNTAVRFQGGAGTTTAGLSFGGDNGPVTANTEEWAVPSKATKVLTD